MSDHHHLPNDRSFDASPDVLTATAQGRLRSIIERLDMGALPKVWP